MKKVGSFISFDEQFSIRKKESVNTLGKNTEIQKFLNSNNLTKEIIENNWIDFIEYEEDLNICVACPGIALCPKNFKGYQLQLDYQQDSIKKTYQVCPYGDELNQEMLAMLRIIKNVPEELLKTTFNDIKVNNQGNVVEILLALNTFITKPTKKGVYLYGDMGVGKTYIMAAFINKLAKNGYTCGFINLPELFARLKREFNTTNTTDNTLNEIKQVDFLVLDDVGAESLSSWSRDEVLYSIVNERMNRGLATFFTSVYNLNDLEKYYMLSKSKEERIKSQRIIERIKAISQPLELSGINFRG